ncbi:MAG: hypothetical protein VB009_08420 [Erysipelotrichaceae bacterium]|nr:hypothetical protein [Erysipelotrichaceae bacterium]
MEKRKHIFDTKTRQIAKLANKLVLGYDSKFNFLCGYRNNYTLFIDKPTGFLKPTLIMSIKKKDDSINEALVEDFFIGEPLIKSCVYNKHYLKLTLKQKLIAITTKTATIAELDNLLNRFTKFLSENGFQDCCQNCDHEETYFRLINEGKFILCDDCFNVAMLLVKNNGIAYDKRDSSFFLGLFGAVLGSLLGSLFIFILDQQTLPMYFAGAFMALFTLNGYKLFATHFSKKGLIFCLIWMILVGYLTHRFSWSVTLAEFYETTTSMFFFNFDRLFFEGYVNVTYYLTEISILLSFIIISSISTIIKVISNNKDSYTFKIQKE